MVTEDDRLVNKFGGCVYHEQRLQWIEEVCYAKAIRQSNVPFLKPTFRWLDKSEISAKHLAEVQGYLYMIDQRMGTGNIIAFDTEFFQPVKPFSAVYTQIGAVDAQDPNGRSVLVNWEYNRTVNSLLQR